MNTKMKLKNILTISLAVLLTACTHSNDSVPIQSDSGGYDGEYQNQYQNTPITTTEALTVGAVGVATGYAVGKYVNKPRYSKPKANYSKPVVVVNKHYYYQTKSKVRVLRRYKHK